MLSGSGGGTLKLWDAVTGQPIRTFTGHARWGHLGGVFTGTRRLSRAGITRSSCGTRSRGSHPPRHEACGWGQVSGVFTRRCPRALGEQDLTFKHVKLWNAVTAIIRTFTGPSAGGVTSVAFYLMAPACSRGAGISLSAHGMQRQAVCCTFAKPSAGVISVVFSPDGTVFSR